MGRVLSTCLYQAGHTQLTLIDKDGPEGRASPAYIAAGMLAPYCESILGGSLIYELGRASLSLWQAHLDRLDAGQYYNDRGTLLLAPRGFGSEIAHYLAKISFNTGRCDFYSRLDKTELAAVEPDLDFNDAYLLPQEASLNAREVFKLLGQNLSAKTIWHSASLINLVKPDRSIMLKDTLYTFDWVIDCRGLGSQGLLASLRGVRGEIIRVHAPEVEISRPVRLFHPRHNIYISPYGRHDYVIGATEIEAEDYSPVSVKSCLDLIGYACSIHAGFAEARILELNSHCRPTLPDNLPQISVQNRYISINGLYRHGYLIAPALAEAVKQYLTAETKPYPQLWSE